MIFAFSATLAEAPAKGVDANYGAAARVIADSASFAVALVIVK